MKYKIPLIVPTIASDAKLFIDNIDIFFRLLPINRIIIICKKNEFQDTLDDPRVNILEESEVLNYSTIQKLLRTRYGSKRIDIRVGWYYQQFLKMSFSRICDDEYYLLWDSDTFPVKPIRLFDENGRPYLDFKTEYHKPYFDTLSRIIPGLGKIFPHSFIAEHMLIKTIYMQELLNIIESNNDIDGGSFYEKIINSIDISALSESGFSEFETYGTYIYIYHKIYYSLREWHSFRFGAFFFRIADLNKMVKLWLSKYYDAISFEKHHKISFVRYVVNRSFFRKLFPSQILEVMSLPIRAIRKL